MNKVLIGHSGYVGSTLLKQTKFSDQYRSTNISDIDGKFFELVVCSAAPAQKWLANKNPEDDKKNIDTLISHLDTIECDTFILISTVDVFKSPINVDEHSDIDLSGLHPYGSNRYKLEQFVTNRFSKHLIVRLPGLVGPGLRKNIIFDLLNDNCLDQVDSNSVFQFYPMVNLWYDLTTALISGEKLIHLTSEPVSVSDVARLGFGKNFDNPISNTPAKYDMKTRMAEIFGKPGSHTYSALETFQAIRAYAQSEPLSKK